ncbi:MAG: hypothetical protein ACRDJE_12855 [Dehalococcoidia bacterium]
MRKHGADTQPRQRGRRSYAIGAVILAILAIGLLAGCGSADKESDEPAARLAREQTAGSCEAPHFPPSTRTPDGEDPLANTVTPTPQPPDPQAVGAPSKAVAEEVNAAIRNFVNCWNQRKFDAVVTLSTPSLMKSIFVQVKPADLLTDMNGLPEVLYNIQSLGDLQRHADGRISASIHYIFVHQHRVARWYFIKQDGWWVLDREARTTPEVAGERSVIDIEGKDYTYVISPNPKAAPVTVLRTHNTGPAPHEFILVRIKEGLDFDPLRFLQPGQTYPKEVEFYGQTVLEPGDQEEMVLTDVQPGQYILLCLLRYPGGIYHPAAGMVSFVEFQ